MFGRFALAATVAAAWGGAGVLGAGGSGWVKDASTAPFPSHPVQGSVSGKPVTLKVAQMVCNGTMTMDDLKFNQVTLNLRSNDSVFPDAEASMTFLVKRGQKPDGKTFVRLPASPARLKGKKSYFADLKPAEVVPGQGDGTRVPLLQSLSLSAEGAGKLDDGSGAEALPTMRLQFGQRRGKVLPGKIYLCWSDPKKSYVAGAFEAVVESDSYQAPR
jgi:hypothetical protein